MSGARNYWTTSESPPRRQAVKMPKCRRWLLDGVGVVACLVLIAGAVLYMRTRQEKEALIERAATELRRVELEMKYRAAAKLPGLNAHGWPAAIDEEWFQGPSGVPRNPLVSSERPWIDMASADELDQEHPMVKMTADPKLAGFWYNPSLGVIRARVPVMVSDDETLELYNRVNGTHIASIFGSTNATSESDGAHTRVESTSKSKARIEITTTGRVRRTPGE